MLGRGVNAALDQALGGSPAMVGFSFTGRASTPWGSGTILLAQPITTVWGATSGSPNAPGIGTMSVPMLIPNNQTLSGMRVDLQGFVLDPGARDGFASTGGTEMWLR
jgi:hypothetical protein